MSVSLEICILAGGLSQRMGRDKSRLRLGRKTMLGVIRTEAGKAGVPVRVIRRDLVERCGPLGGIYTALKKTKAEAVLFLACDMPFISEALLRKMTERFSKRAKGIFANAEGRAGFPAILRKSAMTEVEEQLAAKTYSIGRLAERMGAQLMRPNRREMLQLTNLNTPEEWAQAKEIFSKKPQKSAVGCL